MASILLTRSVRPVANCCKLFITSWRVESCLLTRAPCEASACLRWSVSAGSIWPEDSVTIECRVDPKRQETSEQFKQRFIPKVQKLKKGCFRQQYRQRWLEAGLTAWLGN